MCDVPLVGNEKQLHDQQAAAPETAVIRNPSALSSRSRSKPRFNLDFDTEHETDGHFEFVA